MRGWNAGGRSGVERFFDSYHRAQDRKTAAKTAERQADMQSLQYFTNILDKDLPEGMHQTAFESVKGLMKKNSESLGISADYDWDSLKWDASNDKIKGSHKKLKNLLAETKRINPDTGEPMLSMADAEIGIREIGLELTSAWSLPGRQEQASMKPLNRLLVRREKPGSRERRSASKY
jgi:hypothetical protein